MNDKDIQWHPGFVAAMELELMEYNGKLDFKMEHSLNTKPLQIDLLIIKKYEPIDITNETGRIFKKYNIMEYKSPNDSLNIDTLYKSQAYAALYKTSGNIVNEINADDITVSLVRERKPVELFKHLKSKNVQITMPFNGIYYINDMVLFPTQIIVTDELSGEEHTWIKSLSHKLKIHDMQNLLYHIVKLRSDYEKELADSVLEVALRANKTLIEKLRGDGKMSGALRELLEPVIQDQKQIWKQEGRQEGKVIGTIDTLRSLNYNNEEIKTIIKKNYNLSEEATEKYMMHNTK